MKFLYYWFLTLLVGCAPLGHHRLGDDKLFGGRICPRCVVAAQREGVVAWRR